MGCFWWTHIYRLFRHHGPLVGSSWLFPSFCPCTGAGDIPRRVLDCSGSLSNFLFRSFGPRNSWHVNLCDFRLERLKSVLQSKEVLSYDLWSQLVTISLPAARLFWTGRHTQEMKWLHVRNMQCSAGKLELADKWNLCRCFMLKKMASLESINERHLEFAE